MYEASDQRAELHLDITDETLTSLATASRVRTARAHTVRSSLTRLGETFITCSCGHVSSGGAFDDLATRNHAHHIKTGA